jgi:hypothetical protein
VRTNGTTKFLARVTDPKAFARAVAWQWPDFGGHVRALRRINWLRYKEKNGTAWTYPADLSSEALAKAEAVPPDERLN